MPWGNSESHFRESNNKRSTKVERSEFDKKSKKKKKNKSEEFWDNAVEWAYYWRENPHRFVEECIGIKLKLFQKILLYIMNMREVGNFTYIASRGTGKSWLLALFAIVRAILYPDSKITLAVAVKKNALDMLGQYFKKFRDDYPVIYASIKNISTNLQDPYVEFHNGSMVTVSIVNENARGKRANLIIGEEYRLINKEIFDSAIKPFLTATRHAPFMDLPEYSGTEWQEPNKLCMISSAWLRGHWSYKHLEEAFNGMRSDDNNYYNMAFSTDISLAIESGLYDMERFKREMEQNKNSVSFLMEYRSIFWGESENALFTYDEFDKNRVIKKAVYPNDDKLFFNKKKMPRPMKYNAGRFGILSCDVAVSSKKDSDNTIVHYAEIIETKSGYIRELKYSMSMNGKNHADIDLAVKKLIYDFNIDYLALDVQGIGIAILDEMGTETYDPIRDLTYPAICSFNDDDYRERAIDKNAVSMIYTVNASANLNDAMIKDLSATMKSGKLHFLIDDDEFKSMMLARDEKYITQSAQDRINMELPYIQTNLLVTETINLDVEILNGKIKVKEKGKARKDRFSSLLYLNALASHLEHDYLKSLSSSDDSMVWVDVY